MQQQVIDLESFHYHDGISITLEDTDLEFNPYQYSDNGTGCFYLENEGSTNPKLVFMFLTRATLTILSLQYQDNTISEGILAIPTLGVCNTSCDFIWNSDLLSGNCRTYKKLIVLVQGRQQLCYNENLTINVSVRSEMVMINVGSFNLIQQ